MLSIVEDRNLGMFCHTERAYSKTGRTIATNNLARETGGAPHCLRTLSLTGFKLCATTPSETGITCSNIQQGVPTEATCNIQQRWELLATNVASVCTGLILYYTFFLSFFFCQDYKLDFFLRQLWNDPRLKHNRNETLAVSNSMLDKIWLPDTYFENSKSSQFHKVTMINKLLSISPDGGVHYNARYSSQ